MIAIGIIVGLIGGSILLANPFLGLVLTVFMVPMAMMPAVGGGILGIFSAATPIKLVGGMTFIGAFVRQLSSGKKWSFLKEPTVRSYHLLLIYIVLNGLAMPSSFSRENFTFYISIAMFGFLIVTQVNSLKRLRLILWIYLVSVFFVSVRAILTYNTIKLLDPTYRSSGGTFDPNYFAISLLPFIAISFYTSGIEKKGWLRMLSLAFSLIFLAAFGLTQSRGGFLGLCVMLLIAFLTAKKKALALVLILISGVVTFTLMPAHFWERFKDSKIELQEGEQMNEASGSSIRRHSLGKAAWEMFKDYPVFGVGIGDYYWRCSDYVGVYAGRAHNMHLEILAELGAVGYFLFGSMVLSFFACLKRLSRAPPPYNKWAKAFFVGHIGFLAAAWFLHAQQEKGFWLIMFLAVAMERIWRNEQKTQPIVEGPVTRDRPTVEAKPVRTKWGKRKLGY